MSLLGGSLWAEVDRSTDHHKFLLLNQTYVLGNVWPELFFVYSCWSFLSVLLLFLQQIFMLLFTLPSFYGDFSSRCFDIYNAH